MKRLLSMILVLVLLVGMLPLPAKAVEANTGVASDEVAIEGTNDFGTMLSEEIQAEYAEETAYSGGYSVFGLHFSGNTAEVEYSSMEDAILMVAVYSEDGRQLLTTGKTQVSAEEELAYVTIEGSMPQYFMAAAYLVDTFDYSPLCEAYDTPMYTQEMRELMASTVDDYDAERVVNLDDDKTTNFAVYAEETVIIDYVEGRNQVVTADSENAQYVITNADEQFTSLQPGQVFGYVYGDEGFLVVKVGTISVDGTTVTITGQDLELEEAFSHVKIEGSADASDAEVDTSEMDEDVTYTGLVSDGASTYAARAGGSVSQAFGIEMKDAPIGKTGAVVTAEAKLTIKVDLEFYISGSKSKLELKFNLNVDGTVGVKVKNEDSRVFDLSKKLMKLRMPVAPSVTVSLTPFFVMEMEGGVEVGFHFSTMIGMKVDKNGIQKVYRKPKAELFKVELVGETFIGFKLSPALEVAEGYLAKASLDGKAGFKVKSEMDVFSAGNLGSSGVRHNCTGCMEGDVNAILEVTASAQFLKSKKWQWKVKLITYSLHLWDFYNCFEHGVLDFFNSCPYKEYEIIVEVRDANNDRVAGADVTAGDQTGVTDENGIVSFYFPAGEITIKATYDNSQKSKTIVVSDPQKVKLKMNESYYTTANQIIGEVTEEEILNKTLAGKCGDNAVWSFADGTVTISGTGAIYDYVTYEQPWYKQRKDEVKRVVVEDGITHIGANAFRRCGVKEVVLGKDVVSIGRYAFAEIPLTTISFPEGLETIEEHGFYNISVENLVLPDSVTTIGASAFWGSDAVTVTLPANLTAIEASTFGWCGKLKSVTMGNKLTSIGEAAFERCEVLETIKFSEELESIGVEAFRECTALKEITLPASVKQIEKHAFYKCIALQEAILPGIKSLGDYVFQDCEALETVILSGSMYSMGKGVFKNCYVLTAIDVPNGITAIAQETFYCCRGLQEVTLPDSLESIGISAFYQCMELECEIPSGVSTIESGAFMQCYKLKEVELHNVSAIGSSAFAHCESLTNVTLFGDNYTIDTRAFNFCNNLQEVTLSEGLTAIGENAFSYCTALTKINIPSTVTSIGGWAFENCENLNSSIVIPAGVTRIEASTFNKCTQLESVEIANGVTSIGQNAFRECKALTGLVLPDFLEEIGDGAFYNCYGLTEMVIPNGITSLGNGVFGACYYLERVVLPESLTVIGMNAFNNCSYLKEITIPGNVTSIGQGAFVNCWELPSINIPASVTEIRDRAFWRCESLELIVFEGDAPAMGADLFYKIEGRVSVTTALYPAGNPTWTEDVMQHYGGNVSWRPYDLAAPSPMEGIMEVTVQAAITPEELAAIVPEEEIVPPAESPAAPETWEEIDSAPEEDAQLPEEIAPGAIFGGEYESTAEESYILKTATFRNLVPGEQYILFSFVSRDVEDLLSGSNVLAVDQGTAGTNGVLSFQYIQRVETDQSYVIACGPSNQDLQDATITLPKMRATGSQKAVQPTVVYGGKTLVEGLDYVVVGQVAYTEPGSYTCFVRGIYNYSGLVKCVYTVTAPLPGDVTGDEKTTQQDAIYLIWHTLFPSTYPVEKALSDFNGDKLVTDTDAVLLLWHILFPEHYPL